MSSPRAFSVLQAGRPQEASAAIHMNACRRGAFFSMTTLLVLEYVLCCAPLWLIGAADIAAAVRLTLLADD